MFRSIRFPIIAAIGIVAAVQSAHATSLTERVEVGRVTVNYADLNLGSVADAHALLARLQKAAYRACGGDPRLDPNYDLMAPHIERSYRQCRNEALSRAVTSVNAPLLTDAYRDDDARLARAASTG